MSLNKPINPVQISYQVLATLVQNPTGIFSYPVSEYERVVELAGFVSSSLAQEISEVEDDPLYTDTILKEIEKLPRYLEARLYLPEEVCKRFGVGIPVFGSSAQLR